MLTITNSSSDTFITCHRKYYYSYDLCIKPKKPSWPLVDGEAFHLALERYYGLSGVDNYLDSLRGTEAEIEPYRPILDVIDTFYDQIRGEYETDEYQISQHKALVTGMFKGYSLVYPFNEFEEFDPEVKFQVEVPNPLLSEGKFLLAGKTDGHIKRDNTRYLFETKTTSDNSMARYVNGLLLSTQPTTYLYGFNRMGFDAVGVLYNIVRKCRLKQRTFESDKGFFERIEKAYIEDAGKERKYFYREMVYRTPKEIDEWLEELKQITKDMGAYYAYKSPSRCKDWSGCEFLKACAGGDIEVDYVKKTTQHEELEDGRTKESVFSL